jgi:uncharacterized OsmC-like protein
MQGFPGRSQPNSGRISPAAVRTVTVTTDDFGRPRTISIASNMQNYIGGAGVEPTNGAGPQRRGPGRSQSMSDTDESDATTYRMDGERISPKRLRVDTGDAELVVGNEANPVEYFLASVLACLNSTGTMVARDMGIEIDGLSVDVESQVDYATYLGDESDARPGLQGLDVTMSVDSPADEETLDSWLAAVERRCPITDNVENETGMAVSLDSA